MATLRISLKTITSEVKFAERKSPLLQSNTWLARDVSDVSIFGYPPCWCSTAGEIYICLYAIAVQLLEITMDSSEKEPVPSIDELCSKIPILSEYCRKLEDQVTRKCLEKIAEVGVDPVTIPDEQFNSECLPPIDDRSDGFAKLRGSGNEFLHQTAV